VVGLALLGAVILIVRRRKQQPAGATSRFSEALCAVAWSTILICVCV
jgi:hypothetical protein